MNDDEISKCQEIAKVQAELKVLYLNLDNTRLGDPRRIVLKRRQKLLEERIAELKRRNRLLSTGAL